MPVLSVAAQGLGGPDIKPCHFKLSGRAAHVAGFCFIPNGHVN